MPTRQFKHKGLYWSRKERIRFACTASLTVARIFAVIAVVAAPCAYYAARLWPALGLIPAPAEAIALGFLKTGALLTICSFIVAWLSPPSSIDHQGHSGYSQDRAQFALLESLKLCGGALAFALVAAPFLYDAARLWPEIGLLRLSPATIVIGILKTAVLLFLIWIFGIYKCMQTDCTNHKWHSWHSKDRAKAALSDTLPILAFALLITLIAAPCSYYAVRLWPEIGWVPVPAVNVAFGFFEAAVLAYAAHFIAAYVSYGSQKVEVCEG